MKLKNQINIFLDIGNTNIKFIFNEKDKVFINKTSLFNLIKLILNKNNIYILNVNNKFNFVLNIFRKLNKNIYLFNSKSRLDFKNNFDFNFNEVGNDLLLISNYMVRNNQDQIFMGFGTYLVCMICKNKKIISINLDLGLSKKNKLLNKKFNLKNNVCVSKQNGIDTQQSINLNNYLLIDGIIKSSVENFKLSNYKVILSGNDIINLPDINKILNLKCNYEILNNLTLFSFRDWCYLKFSISHT